MSFEMILVIILVIFLLGGCQTCQVKTECCLCANFRKARAYGAGSISVGSSPGTRDLFTRRDTGHICSTPSDACLSSSGIKEAAN